MKRKLTTCLMRGGKKKAGTANNVKKTKKTHEADRKHTEKKTSKNDSVIDFNDKSARLGLLYAKKFENRVPMYIFCVVAS